MNHGDLRSRVGGGVKGGSFLMEVWGVSGEITTRFIYKILEGNFIRRTCHSIDNDWLGAHLVGSVSSTNESVSICLKILKSVEAWNDKQFLNGWMDMVISTNFL